jgi:hypothetical protein
MPRTTDDLIAALSQSPLPARFAPLRAVWAMLGAACVGVAIYWLIFGLRADVAMAVTMPSKLVKSVLPLGLGALALWLALRSARPGERVPVWVLLVPAALAVGMFVQRLWTVPEGLLATELVGQTAVASLLSITVLSLAPTGIGLWFLRRGAPTRPLLSGALVGLASGAGVAAGYALHCTEDSPLFFVVWYGIAVSVASTVGAVAAGRALRW